MFNCFPDYKLQLEVLGCFEGDHILTKKKRNSVGEIKYMQRYCKIIKGGSFKPKLQAGILQNSQEVEFINQYYRQKYHKIRTRHEYFLTEHILRNMNQLRTSKGRNWNRPDSQGGTGTIVWNVYSYQVQYMVGKNASTNENHKFYNSIVQAV